MSRAEARRRTKETQRAELAADQGLVDDASADGAATTQTATAERKPLFKIPDVLGDLRTVPESFRTKPILFLPAVLFLIGLIIFAIIPNLSTDIQSIASYYIQFFFAPPALFTFFIAGFFAPRAAYLIGFIYGVLAAIVWSVALLVLGSSPAAQSTDPAVTLDAPAVIANMFVIGILYGTFAAALASWYRGFLKGIQDRGNERRNQKEVDERAKRAQERQEARKLAKQRPT